MSNSVACREKKTSADDITRRIGSKKLGSRRVQERRRWWCWTSSPREKGRVWRRRAIKWHERSVPRIGGQAPIGTDASMKHHWDGPFTNARVRSFGFALFLTFVSIAINEIFNLTEMKIYMWKLSNERQILALVRTRELNPLGIMMFMRENLQRVAFLQFFDFEKYK